LQLHVFRSEDVPAKPDFDEARIRPIFDSVAGDTNTHDLVVALYLIGDPTDHAGECVTRPSSPTSFIRRRGRWAISSRFALPPMLPNAFYLIRMRLGVPASYPVNREDRYGWFFRPKNLEEDCAVLFAHELHHFRRHHLGLHPGEGEQSADAWSVEHLRRLGYNVEGGRRYYPSVRLVIPDAVRQRLPTEGAPDLVTRLKEDTARLCEADLRELQAHIGSRLLKFSELQSERQMNERVDLIRRLSTGARVKVRLDPKHKYKGCVAVILGAPPMDARDVLVRMPDGKEWYFPMDVLEPAE